MIEKLAKVTAGEENWNLMSEDTKQGQRDYVLLEILPIIQAEIEKVVNPHQAIVNRDKEWLNDKQRNLSNYVIDTMRIHEHERRAFEEARTIILKLLGG